MSKNNRFEIVYQETGLKSEKTIYVDKETGVNYLFIANGFGGSGSGLKNSVSTPLVIE